MLSESRCRIEAHLMPELLWDDKHINNNNKPTNMTIKMFLNNFSNHNKFYERGVSYCLVGEWALKKLLSKKLYNTENVADNEWKLFLISVIFRQSWEMRAEKFMMSGRSHESARKVFKNNLFDEINTQKTSRGKKVTKYN